MNLTKFLLVAPLPIQRRGWQMSSVCVGLLILMAAALVNPAAAAQVESSSLRAGAAAADITPQQWPLPMVGSFSRRDAMRAWDRLNARAIVLSNDSTTIGIVLVDSCYCPRSLFDEAKRRVQRLTGIAVDHLLMSATHTHSAPASRDRREIEADPDYTEHVIRGIVSAVQQAHANLTPAEIGWGGVDVPEEVFNRRWFVRSGASATNPFGESTDQVRMNPPRGKGLLQRAAGPTDPEVSFLSLRTVDGLPIALLANYSLHYVGGVPAGGVSADYFGEFARQIRQRVAPQRRLGAHPPFVGMMTNGTSGDVNNINFTNPRARAKPFERIGAVASLVADRVFAALEKVAYRRSVPLAMAQSQLTLEVRRPTSRQVARAREFLQQQDESKLPTRAKPYAHWTLLLDSHRGTEELVLQAARIGDVGITAIPCEVFAEIGLSLKAQSPLQPSFTIELANGHYGYLPTPRQHRLGGYETWLGTNILELEASTKIEATLLELLHQID